MQLHDILFETNILQQPKLCLGAKYGICAGSHGLKQVQMRIIVIIVVIVIVIIFIVFTKVIILTIYTKFNVTAFVHQFYHLTLEKMQSKADNLVRTDIKYDRVSDVVENGGRFASKILTHNRMH